MPYYKINKPGARATVKYDFSLLQALRMGIENTKAVKVGILGSANSKNAAREDSQITNAEIGLAHEKGIKSRNLPRRSWLVDPLTEHLPEVMGKLGEKAMLSLLQTQYVKAYAELGLICEQIIQKGFNTGGYGKWAPLKPATIARKGSARILIDSAQFRNSVTSQVVSK